MSTITTTATATQNNVFWATLPTAAIKCVSTRLRQWDSLETLRSLRLVNKHWSRQVSKGLTYLKLENLEKEELSEFLLKLKDLFVNVRRLDVPVVWLDDNCCRELARHATTVQSLELFWGDSISDEGLRELATMPLKSLRIYHSRLITDAGIEVLSKTSLEELWLYGANQVTDDGFRALEKLASLKALRLLYCNRLSRCGLEPLFNREGIQLFVRFCRRISSEICLS